MSFTSRIVAGVAIAAALGVAGAAMLRVSRPPPLVQEGGDAADVAPQRPSASQAPARGFLGVLLANEVVDVAARTDGVLASVEVRLGDQVAEGGVIATIDDRPLRDELAVLRATLGGVQARQQRAELELQEAEERQQRWSTLNSDGQSAVVSGEDLAALQYKEKYARQQLEAIRAEAAEQRARIQSLERRISDAVVRAPFAGHVAQRYVDSGALVRPGEPIARLVRQGDLWVRFAVPAEHADVLHGSREVDVHIEAPAVVLSGVIQKVAPEIEPASGMIFAEARLDASPHLGDAPLAGRAARVHLRPHGQAASPPY